MKDYQPVLTSNAISKSVSKRGTGSSMSLPFRTLTDGMPPDYKEEGPDELDCPVPQAGNKRNSLFELSTLAYADEADEDQEEEESIILVTEEEEGRDPLWTLVSKVNKAEAAKVDVTSQSSGPVSFITGIRMTHGQSPINHPSVPIR